MINVPNKPKIKILPSKPNAPVPPATYPPCPQVALAPSWAKRLERKTSPGLGLWWCCALSLHRPAPAHPDEGRGGTHQANAWRLQLNVNFSMRGPWCHLPSMDSVIPLWRKHCRNVTALSASQGMLAWAAGKDREVKGVTELGRRKMSYCSSALRTPT